MHWGFQLKSSLKWNRKNQLKKIILGRNNNPHNKPHMTSQLRKAIMKTSRLKNKANNGGKPADETSYETDNFSG